MHIGEIALRAGVSRSTVSYALSGKRPVSALTRARIDAVIAEVGYRPSATARALKAGVTDTIALLVPRRTRRLTPNQLPFVAAVVETAEECGLDVLLSAAGAHAGTAGLARLVAERRVDGVVLMETCDPDPLAQALTDLGAPFVTIGRTSQGARHDWVDVDQESAVAACTRHLLKLGHRRISLVLGDQHGFDTGYGVPVHSQAGFRAALAGSGASGTVHPCAEGFDGGFTLGSTLARDASPPTGLVVANDYALLGLSAAFRARGWSVPRDISVVVVVVPGAAASGGSQLPPLTGVDVPVDDMASGAVRALWQRLQDPNAPQVQRLLGVTLVERGSTAAPAQLAGGVRR